LDMGVYRYNPKQPARAHFSTLNRLNPLTRIQGSNSLGLNSLALNLLEFS